jgi:hypothetical protein
MVLHQPGAEVIKIRAASGNRGGASLSGLIFAINPLEAQAKHTN